MVFSRPKIAKSFTILFRRLSGTDANEGDDEMHTFLPVLNEVEKQSLHERQPLPEAYLGLSDEEMELRIAAAKAALGERLVILGHHYQRDEVIKFADYTGDSWKLSREASRIAFLTFGM